MHRKLDVIFFWVMPPAFAHLSMITSLQSYRYGRGYIVEGVQFAPGMLCGSACECRHLCPCDMLLHSV